MQPDEWLRLSSLAGFPRRASGSHTELKRYLLLILHIVSCDPVADVCFISICQKPCQGRCVCLEFGSMNPPLEKVLSFGVW